MNPFEFLDELFNAKTRLKELSAGEDFVILAFVVLTQCQRVLSCTVSEIRTDNSIVANTGLYIARYADSLQK